jgi:hypothetical protein
MMQYFYFTMFDKYMRVPHTILSILLEYAIPCAMLQYFYFIMFEEYTTFVLFTTQYNVHFLRICDCTIPCAMMQYFYFTMFDKYARVPHIIIPVSLGYAIPCLGIQHFLFSHATFM